MNYTLETAGRSQLLIWKAETGWLTSLYEKNTSACSNNPGQINLIEANCLLRCNPNESCSSHISFCFRPKIQKLSSRFHKSELCWENKKEDAVWKLPKMDKLIKSFCLVVTHKLIISMVLYGVYIVVIQLQARLPWWMVWSANQPKGNWHWNPMALIWVWAGTPSAPWDSPSHFYQMSTAEPTWLPSSLSSAHS